MIKIIQKLDNNHVQLLDLFRQLGVGRLDDRGALVPTTDYLSLLNHIINGDVQPSMEEAMSFQLAASQVVQKYTHVYIPKNL